MSQATPAYNPSPAFREAAEYLSTAPALVPVPNATKLELYAIYKCLTVSPTPNTSKPSIFDFTGKAKWEAWRTEGQKYKDRLADAEARYLEIARSLGWSEGLVTEPQAAAASKPAATGRSGGEDDLWDTEEETAKWKHDKSAIGHITSTVAVDEQQKVASELSNMAISGDVQGLLWYLDAHSDADVNATDENGYTPLHLAADRGHAEVVKALLERGADKDIKDEDEFTAKELAEVAGHDEIVKLLSDTHNASS